MKSKNLKKLLKKSFPHKLLTIFSAVFSKYIFNIFIRNIKYPDIRENSVLLIEFYNVHGETLPGFIKYLLDLNFNVDVVLNKDNKGRNDFGLFSEFILNEKTRIISLSGFDINYLLRSVKIKKYRHIIINTYTNSCESDYLAFVNMKKLQPVCVVHNSDLKNKYFKSNKIISLVNIKSNNRKPTIVVNSHYFCNINKRLYKGNESNIVTFTALNKKSLFRRNLNLLFSACDALYKKGITNFIVKVIGKGIPVPECYKNNIIDYGFLDFQAMYKEIIDSDFFLALIDQESVQYKNKASGSYQISYGFLKPIILHSQFAEISNLDNTNSILYNNNNELPDAMEKCINMSNNEYSSIVNNLEETEKKIYILSLNNLKETLDLPLKYEK